MVQHSLFKTFISAFSQGNGSKRPLILYFSLEASGGRDLIISKYLVSYFRLKPCITVPSVLTRSVVLPFVDPPMRYVPTPLCGVQDWEYMIHSFPWEIDGLVPGARFQHL